MRHERQTLRIPVQYKCPLLLLLCLLLLLIIYFQNLISFRQGTGVVHLDHLSHPKHKFATLEKSDGTSLYLTRDIAAAIDRYKTYSFDRMYYVVDKSQEGHFLQMKEVLKKLNLKWAER